MNIDSIQNGVVLDHIQAGKSMDIYRDLHLDELDCSVAIIKNVRSGRMGKKDIIKIDSPMELDLDVLGYIDANITVNIIRGGVRVEKKHLELPKKLVNIIRSKNPRCITAAEPQLDAIFLLSDPATRTYRCAYCETAKGKKACPPASRSLHSGPVPGAGAPPETADLHCRKVFLQCRIFFAFFLAFPALPAYTAVWRNEPWMEASLQWKTVSGKLCSVTPRWWALPA